MKGSFISGFPAFGSVVIWSTACMCFISPSVGVCVLCLCVCNILKDAAAAQVTGISLTSLCLDSRALS